MVARCAIRCLISAEFKSHRKVIVVAVEPFRKRCHSKYTNNLTRKPQRDVVYHYTTYKHPLKCSNRQQKKTYLRCLTTSL